MASPNLHELLVDEKDDDLKNRVKRILMDQGAEKKEGVKRIRLSFSGVVRKAIMHRSKSKSKV